MYNYSKGGSNGMAKELDSIIDSLKDDQEFKLSKIILHLTKSYKISVSAIVKRFRLHKVAGNIKQLSNSDTWVRVPRIKAKVLEVAKVEIK